MPEDDLAVVVVVDVDVDVVHAAPDLSLPRARTYQGIIASESSSARSYLPRTVFAICADVPSRDPARSFIEASDFIGKRSIAEHIGNPAREEMSCGVPSDVAIEEVDEVFHDGS